MPPEPTLGEIQYRTVRLSDLITDGRFNRPVNQAAVEKIVSDFDAKAFGAIVLWQNDDGKLVIIDGQHRVESARLRGTPEDAKCIPSIVHIGLDLAHVARLFVKYNATMLVRSYDKFEALMTAQEPETLAINAIVLSNGLIVGRSVVDGAVREAGNAVWEIAATLVPTLVEASQTSGKRERLTRASIGSRSIT